MDLSQNTLPWIIGGSTLENESPDDIPDRVFGEPFWIDFRLEIGS